MDKILLRAFVVIALAIGSVSLRGQGTVNFNTQALGPSAILHEPFYLEGTGGPNPVAGTNFFAQLYAAAGTGSPSSSLVPVGIPVNFKGGVNAGYVQTSGLNSLGMPVDSAVMIPFLAPGGPATIQMRAWWGGGNIITTFEEAITFINPNSQVWFSNPINLLVTGNSSAQPPIVPVDLIGLHGNVPEPSPASLVALGIVALLFFRRLWR